jgi:type VI secretion system secreted protein Hcp
MLKTKLAAAAVTSVAALAAVPSAHAATDYFMTVTPVGGQAVLKGETLDTYYQPKGAIEIKSFRWSAENTVTLGSASGGAGAGKAQLGELTVEKSVDSTTPQFLKNLTTGQHFQRVQIFARKAGDKESAWTAYSFAMVFVKGQTQSGSAGDDVPNEELTFAYGAVGQQVKRQANGAITAGVFESTWSQILNKPAAPADVPFS